MNLPLLLPISVSTALLVLVGIIVTKRKANKKKLQEQVEQSKPLLEQINQFFTAFAQSKDSYISNTEKNYYRSSWEPLFLTIRKKKFNKAIPNFQQMQCFMEFFANLEAEVENHNAQFVQSEIAAHDNFLSDIDGKSLDTQQRTVVVTDEDNVLVLAGAGSGKTLTIAAKVKYLCQIKNINPRDILLISFTNKSAEEMTERIQSKLGIPVEASTFHKLGLNIIKEALQYRPKVFDDLHSFVHGLFEGDLLQHPDFVQSLTEYFAFYLDIPEDMSEKQSLGELYEKEKSLDLETLKSKYDKEKYIDTIKDERKEGLKTLRDERVKSLEEIKIANFLFTQGVEYEYERDYPFESADPQRKNYQPDFYLPEYDIYLEHFGITRDNTVPWLSPVEEKKYLDGIEWKRQFHQQNGTKLIETYSYYASEGILFEQLERILKENAIPLQPRDFNDIFEIIYSKKSNKYFSDFISLCCTFISLFKARSYDMEELDRMILACSQQDNKFIAARNRIFLSIVKYVLSQYQQYLEETKSIDFSDMINLATKQVENGCEIYNYKYIIVDEYQDISLARFRLLKSILNRTKARFLCVGDDWQSIYRFAGSDIALFTKFEDYLGFTKLLKIEKTYRNSQQLIDEASHFVTKNPNQLQKSLTSDKALRYPLVFWGIDSNFSEVLNLVLKKIIMDFGADKSILLLGRTNYDRKLLEGSGLFLFRREQRAEKIVYRESPQTPISFLSVHKSKGLEADNVVLLNFTNDRLGFPNQIADDKVLDFVLTDGCTFPFEEERRLFYVAITRTKNRTFILTENKNPSVFFKEFKQSDAVCFVSIKSAEDKGQAKCPRCKTGDLLKVSKNGKTFVGCSNFPRCDYTINDSSVLANPKKCPSCGGFLVKRKGKSNHWFVGCSNYPYCTHTEQLNKM